jgi:hypothetical protein
MSGYISPLITSPTLVCLYLWFMVFVEFRGQNSLLVGVNVTPRIFGDYVISWYWIYTSSIMVLSILELHSCDSFSVSAVFAVLRENGLVAPFGEIYEFCTWYRCDSDKYNFRFIFIWFIPSFVIFSVFRKTVRFRRYGVLPSFRILFSVGVLIPDFGDLHDILFNVWKYILFSFFYIKRMWWQITIWPLFDLNDSFMF